MATQKNKPKGYDLVLGSVTLNDWFFKSKDITPPVLNVQIIFLIWHYDIQDIQEKTWVTLCHTQKFCDGRQEIKAVIALMRRMDLSANTFYRRVREYEAEYGIAEPTSAWQSPQMNGNAPWTIRGRSLIICLAAKRVKEIAVCISLLFPHLQKTS